MVAELRAEREAAPSPEEVESLRADATEAHELRSEVESLRAETGDDAGVLAGLRAEAEEARAEAERLAAELDAREPSAARGRGRAARGRARGAARREARHRRARGAADRGREVGRGAVDELAGLRLAHGSLKAAHEQLEDELEALRGVRDERDELAGPARAAARRSRPTSSRCAPSSAS